MALHYTLPVYIPVYVYTSVGLGGGDDSEVHPPATQNMHTSTFNCIVISIITHTGHIIDKI